MRSRFLLPEISPGCWFDLVLTKMSNSLNLGEYSELMVIDLDWLAFYGVGLLWLLPVEVTLKVVLVFYASIL